MLLFSAQQGAQYKALNTEHPPTIGLESIWRQGSKPKAETHGGSVHESPARRGRLKSQAGNGSTEP